MSDIPAPALQAAARAVEAGHAELYVSGGIEHLEFTIAGFADFLAAVQEQTRREIADEFRALAARYRAVPDKGLTLGQVWDRDEKARQYDRIANMIQRETSTDA